MIIFMADGRLGNQIFQFAFLKQFARKNEIILCLNMAKFFDVFECDLEDVINCGNRYIIYLMRRLVIPYLIVPLSRLGIVGYVEQKKDDNKAPLSGYFFKNGLLSISFVNIDFFQSEFFFDLDSFSSNFKIKLEYRLAAYQFLDDIPDEYTKVFIHVRRGDYLLEYFGGIKGISLPKRYFKNAVKIVKNKIKNPFFIFLSDDPSYVERCFDCIRPKIISRNSAEVDLAIMSQCTCGIISNSSFSWWGSALMEHKTLVIVPKYWYGWKQKVDSHPSIYPSWGTIIDVNGL
ncbi:alpha-1,2-fucosyltransferase [Methylomonas sp. EFPC1]|uniref:alpha-1,2-fucosyltransferase n=1 Tax=Methylomonas sp. EFPC1 TaxID=2812647 RepID=UPI0019688F9A|nr:alpha-1,2-fucosyltransferase [Methylomonas sp. EFPC1]QSA99632.1 alpha-1,2-fucosyltransferase [Methylomonas sp. EFPC1]